jgi:transposase
MILYFVDESHLLWGDACGYVWGRTDRRIEVPMMNEKQRQTYFGALNYLSGETVIKEYPKGLSTHTVAFLKHLLHQHPGKRISVFWDGATYHRSAEVKAYLSEVNKNLSEEAWRITCFLFAPHAPEQNPIEDVWLQGKNFVRENYHRCASFSDVKDLFTEKLLDQPFEFQKLLDYRSFLRTI